jgi:hypothetical protein
MDPVPDPAVVETLADTDTVMLLRMLYGALIPVGILSCFFGFKLFKLCISLLGAAAGGVAGIVLGYHLGVDPLPYAVGGLFVGVILGFLLGFFFFNTAVATLAAAAAANLTIPWLDRFGLYTQLIILFAACLVAALFAIQLSQFTIKIGTAFIGSFAIVYALWFFNGGPPFHTLVKNPSDWLAIGSMYPLPFVIAIFIGAIGLFTQLRASTG